MGEQPGGEPQGLDRKEMWDQLTRVITMRVNQDQVGWRIFAAFWAANAILLVALFRDGQLPTNSAVTIAVTSVGVWLSVTWFLIERRALGHLARYDRLIGRLETRLRIPPELTVSPTVNRLDYDACMPRWPPGRPTMIAFNILSGLLWAAALVGWGILR